MNKKLSKEAYGGVNGKDYVPYINDKSKKGTNLAVLLIGIVLSLITNLIVLRCIMKLVNNVVTTKKTWIYGA